jgi:hypothetical protein
MRTDVQMKSAPRTKTMGVAAKGEANEWDRVQYTSSSLGEVDKTTTKWVSGEARGSEQVVGISGIRGVSL